MYAGFISVNQTANGSLYYWFLEALQPNKQNTDIPILIWLNGGPGSSSLFGLFGENGMFRINKDLSLSQNPYTWNTKYHMMFVDQPIGTGFAYCNKGEYVVTETQLAAQFLTFLQGFYACHPNYLQNPLYITGESYAGRYIPFITMAILDAKNKGTATVDIPLQGLAIGNGHYDPNIQFRAPADVAHGLGILDLQEYLYTQSQVDMCLNASFIAENADAASTMCQNVTNNIYSIYAGNIFQYNVYERNIPALNAKDNRLPAYLAQPAVAKALNTRGIPWTSSDGTSAPNPVSVALNYDVILNNSAIFIPQILGNDTRILFYNGQFDGSVWNNLGNSRCLNQFNYEGKWIALPKYPYKCNGNVTCGYVKFSDKNPVRARLTYFVVSDSGHLAPEDQPATTLDMITTWIEQKEWT